VQQLAYNDNGLTDTINAPEIAKKDTGKPHARKQLQALKQAIQKIERSAETELDEPEANQQKTPEHKGPSLPAGHSHEIWAARPADYTAAMSFILGVLPHTEKPILWVTSNSMIREYGMLYGPGLLAHGIDPRKITIVRCTREKDALWTMEEGLKSSALSAVIGELTKVDLKSSRRLSLASREHKSRHVLRA